MADKVAFSETPHLRYWQGGSERNIVVRRSVTSTLLLAMARRLPSVAELSRLCITTRTQHCPALLSDTALRSAADSAPRAGWDCRQGYAQLAYRNAAQSEEAAEPRTTRPADYGTTICIETCFPASATSPHH